MGAPSSLLWGGRGRHSTSHAVDTHEVAASNKLRGAGNVVYLDLVHAPEGAGRTTQVLQMLKEGEVLTVKQPGSIGKSVKLEVVEHFVRVRVVTFSIMDDLVPHLPCSDRVTRD